MNSGLLVLNVVTVIRKYILFNFGFVVWLVKRRAIERRVAKFWLEIRCSSAWLCFWKRKNDRFPILDKADITVVLALPDKRPCKQIGSVLELY